MTVEEMRAIMRRRVVPENLVVQNIIEYLMDESAQLPQMNAFSFLSRLHELGMGSADFLTLLEGCGAPEQVVEKIKANPAMNLHNLVLTLENSELTPDDYSEMLYTARLVWEQTKTSGGTIVPEMRGIKSAGDYDGEEIPPETENEKSVSEIFDDVPEKEDIDGGDSPNRDFSDGEPKRGIISGADPLYSKDNFSDEDLSGDEPSFEEIMRHASGAGVFGRGEKSSEMKNEKDATQEELSKAENSLSYADKAENSESETEEKAKDNDENGANSSRGVNDTTTLIISLDPEKLKRDIEKKATPEELFDEPQDNEDSGAKDSDSEEADDGAENDGIESSAEADDNENADENEDSGAEDTESEEDEDEKELSRVSLKKLFSQSDDDEIGSLSDDKDEFDDYDDENDDSFGDEYDENDEFDDDEDEESGSRARLRASKYHKPALLISAAGAVVLFLLCAYLTYFKPPMISEIKPQYAQSTEEIFSEIYESYTAGNMGGANARAYFSGEKLFGNYLITQDEFGIFTDGTNVYSAFPEKISVYSGFNTNAAENGEILPPQNTEFVGVFEGEGFITAVFSGEECGFTRIENGEATFTVRQDGELCDFAVGEGEISFGSVYVPRYTHSFGAADVNEYLPRVGINEKTALAAENIVLGGASGCSYVVCGRYSLSDGGALSVKAALGDPIYCGAYGVCAMNCIDKDGKKFGKIIRLADEISTVKTDEITLGASGDNVSSFLTENQIIILDENLEEKSVLQNFAQIPSGMKFEGRVLLLQGEDGIFSAINCADPANPAVMETKKANGVVSKNSAAVFDTENTLCITLLRLENGAASEIAKYEKTFSQSELSTVELGGAKTTAFCDDACAFAFSYFDGVSIISDCVVFTSDEKQENPLFDDRTGYTAVFAYENKIIAVSSKGAKTVFE